MHGPSSHPSYLIFLLIATAAAWSPRTAEAHAARSRLSTNTFFWVAPSDESIDGVFSIAYGDVPALEIRRAVDRDGDGELSPSELRDFSETLGEALSACIELRVGSRPLQVTWTWQPLALDDTGVVPSWLRVDFAYSAPVEGEGELEVSITETCDLPARGEAEYRIEPPLGSVIDDVRPPATEIDGHFALTFTRLPPPIVRVRFHATRDTTGMAAPSGPSDLPEPEPNILADLLRDQEVITLWGLLLAFALGAVHALSPGHGKTLVAAYLVGERGTPWQALLLGLVVTVTHVASVIALGVLALFATEYILPESISRILTIVSGVLILIIGAGMLVSRWRNRDHHHHHHHHPGPGDHHHDSSEGHHEHHHHEHHHHAHDHHHHEHAHPEPSVSLWRLLTLGISGGMVPCPSATVVLLLAIAVGRVAEGMLLIAAFSLGLAMVLVTIGVMVVKASKLLDRMLPDRRKLAWLPILSALIVTGVGLVITLEGVLSIV